jgi:hypothetical protein
MIHQVLLFNCALAMQVYYLKCSDQVEKIQNQHGRYHFLLQVLHTRPIRVFGYIFELPK